MSWPAKHVALLEPLTFGYNPQTAVNNVFQYNSKESNLSKKVKEEFNGLVQLLSNAGIEVTVFEDLPQPPKPDAVFLNNWFCVLPSGKLIVFPLYASNRRTEKRDDILAYLHQNFNIVDVEDWSEYEAENQFLESTGSMVFDHQNKIIYAALSSRTSWPILNQFAIAHQYKAIPFTPKTSKGDEIYHTNVVMSVGTNYAVVCLDVIQDENERVAVQQLLALSGHEVIKITEAQMFAFAGNMLQVQNQDGELFIVMSTTAYNVLNYDQINLLKQHNQLIVADVSTIEKLGGGSVRCMLAEILVNNKTS